MRCRLVTDWRRRVAAIESGCFAIVVGEGLSGATTFAKVASTAITATAIATAVAAYLAYPGKL